MAQPKTFRDSDGKVWNTSDFDDSRYSTSIPKRKPVKKAEPKLQNLLGKT